MALKPGDKLGPYEILSPLGKGGMGEVWRAHDPRLRRDVAIKTSAEHFSERFEREAHAIAALNHPNICQIYDVGPNYLVMEHIEGTPLKGPLPLDQTLKYAAQICEALDAAHRKGITHRDLKPANILVTKAGIKLLDFGLAQLSSVAQASQSADEATATMALTGKNEIVGTLFYMSPEQLQSQATNQELDGRSDIFSFGLVLYELLTGKRAIEGTSPASVIAAIMERPAPSITDVAPPALDRLLKKCLEKDREDRWQSARDLKFELEWIAAGLGIAGPVPAQSPTRFGKAGWLAAAVVTLALAVLAFVHVRETSPDEPVIRATLTIPEGSKPAFVALSPEGQHLIVSMRLGDKPSQLFLRSLDSTSLRPLPNTDQARSPFWSPDGKSIGFIYGGKLKTMSASGGPAQTLCDAYGGGDGAWNGSGVILFTNRQGSISRVSAAGGACTAVTKAESPDIHFAPAFLPDGIHFLYLARTQDESKRGVFLTSLDDRAGTSGTRRVLADPVGVVYAPRRPGSLYAHLLFLRGTTLLAQPFDERSLQTVGDPFAVAEHASWSLNGSKSDASVSPGGELIFVANLSQDALLTWRDRSGTELAHVGSIARSNAVSLSPDGKIVATSRTQDGVSSLWLHDLSRNAEAKLTEPGGVAVWSPDAKRIAYSKGNDLFVRDAVGGGGENVLLRNGNPKAASSWSRDSHYLFYTEVSPTTGSDIWYLEDPLGKATPVRFPGQNENGRSQAQLSPDGHWVAYTFRGEVYLRPFPNGAGLWKVSTGGGAEPRWSDNGKEIFYVAQGNPKRVMAANVHPGGAGGMEIGTPQKLFEFRALTFVAQSNQFSYAIAPDGRFLATEAADSAPPTIELISNWQKLAAGAKGN